MTAILKMNFFLVVLAFGFFAPLQVDAIKCYSCPLRSPPTTCNTTKDCPELPSCHKGKGKLGFTDFTVYSCGNPEDSGKGSCGPYKNGELELCKCFTDFCNSVGHLHGWTFIQLIAISAVVIIVGVGANP